MNRTVLISSGFFALLFSGVAFAGGVDQYAQPAAQPSTSAASTFYIGAQGGYFMPRGSNRNENTFNEYSLNQVYKDGYSWGVNLGYRPFGEPVRMQLSYAYYVADTSGVTVNGNRAGAASPANMDLTMSTLMLDDAAIVVLASGFLDPGVNSNGPAFGLWVALPAGGDLVELPTSTTTSLNEIDSENFKLNLYPNPAKNIINVEISDLAEMNISITNIVGEQIQNKSYSVNRNSIDISGLAQGAYQITISQNNKVIGHSKFIKY